MKEYFGNYLGMVINSCDPEYRGRVQVFIPHIMPALYEDWNKEGVDIQISCVGSNIPEGLSPEIHERLVKILPWAESASPIIGGSAPGNLFSSILGGAAAGAATGGVAGALVGAAAGAANHFYNQSPTSNPVVGPIGDVEITNQAAAAADATSRPWSAAFISYAAKSADPNFPGATMHTSYANSVKTGKAPGWSTLNPANTQIQPGDIVIKNREGSKNSFNGSWQGSSHGDIVTSVSGGEIRAVGGNVSNSVTNVKVNPSQTFAILRPPPDVAQKMVQTAQQEQQRWSQAGWKEGDPSSWGALNAYWNAAGSSLPGVKAIEGTAASAAPAPASPQTNKEGIAGAAPTPQQGAIVPTEGAGQVAGTVSGGGTVSDPGISKGALEYAMRIAAAETGAIGTPNTGKGTASYISNLNNTIAMSQGIKNGYEVRGVSFSRIDEIAETLKSQGKVDSSVLDIGYTQHNARDMKAYGITNSGSYKDQILSVARHVQNQADKNPTFAAYLNAREFTKAEALAGASGEPGTIVPGWRTTIYNSNHIANKNALSSDIATKYGNDPYAALEALNNEYPPTDTIETMLGPNYVPPGGKTWSPPGGAPGAGGPGAGGNAGPSVVNNTDSNGRTPVFNTNDMAKGMFAYPNPGAMVWVFFREGNPLYPVYFAASYSSAEWQSAYRGSSPGDLRNHSNPGEELTTSTIQNFGALSLLSKTHISLTNPLENESVASFHHEQGSGFIMTNHCDFYRSASNRRDEVDNDRHIVTRGYKEEWVQGDASTNTRGDAFIKIGNISQEAIDAMTELSNMSYEANQKLMNKPK